MPPKIRNEYNKAMTTEIDKRAQLKYAREQGQTEARSEIARALLAKGMAPELVKEITGVDSASE